MVNYKKLMEFWLWDRKEHNLPEVSTLRQATTTYLYNQTVKHNVGIWWFAEVVKTLKDVQMKKVKEPMETSIRIKMAVNQKL